MCLWLYFTLYEKILLTKSEVEQIVSASAQLSACVSAARAECQAMTKTFERPTHA